MLQSLTTNSIFLVFIFWVFFHFTYIGRDIFTALLIIESWWILIYFLYVFLGLFLNLALPTFFIPLILIFAGLEVVLGFYLMYFI